MERPNGSRLVLYGAFFAISFATYAALAHATEVSDVTISSIETDKATIEWETDTDSNAMINYGLDDAFGVVRDPTFGKKHLLSIENLDPSTTYHFRVVSTDQAGNTAATAGFVFTTKGQTKVDKILKEIKQVTGAGDLEIISKAVQQQAQDEIKPPAIIGKPNVIPTEEGAIISWSTDREASSQVDLAPEGEYSPNSTDPYSISQGDSNESVKEHEVQVIGLDPSTTYHFSVTSTDSLGMTGASADNTFDTKSQIPVVSALKASKVQETSATISWKTSIPAKGVVQYTNLRTKATKSAGNPVFATSQNVILTGLEFGTRYNVVVVATNKAGDNYETKPISFITVRDIVAPIITKVNNESTLFPSDDAKVQTILSWTTDEPASCQVYYTQGLGSGDGATADTLQAEKEPVTDHTQVVVGFTPGTVYRFWMKCHDPSMNETQSDDFVLITPVKEKNIIDIILENFQGTFGWVNKIGK